MKETNQNIDQLINHLFRHETGKIIAVLTKVFGTNNIELAEDVVQDTLIDALKTWNFKGIPENPSGWLYTVAKNKAVNIINRKKYERQYASDQIKQLNTGITDSFNFNQLFTDEEIKDDELRMIFTCCHPSVSEESQVALILKTLCGFSIPEITKASLSTKETINKRLVRARQKIRENSVAFEIPKGKELNQRLDAVLKAIYLLFNEGYSASVGASLIRYELCEEAIRLTKLLSDHEFHSGKANIYALLALMLLNASRFKAREKEGRIVEMKFQDRSLWNKEMITNGLFFLQKASEEKVVSSYLILATISAHYSTSLDYNSVDWEGILKLYDNLLQIEPSEIVQLNRAVIEAKVKGVDRAIEGLENLKTTPILKNYHSYYYTIAELYIEKKDYSNAIINLNKALELSNLNSEKELLKEKISFCNKNI